MAARHLGRRHGRSGRHGCRGGGGARIKDRTVAVRWRRRRTTSLQLVDVERQAKEPPRERKLCHANSRPHCRRRSSGDGTKQTLGGGEFAGRPRPSDGTKQTPGGGEAAGRPEADVRHRLSQLATATC